MSFIDRPGQLPRQRCGVLRTGLPRHAEPPAAAPKPPRFHLHLPFHLHFTHFHSPPSASLRPTRRAKVREPWREDQRLGSGLHRRAALVEIRGEEGQVAEIDSARLVEVRPPHVRRFGIRYCPPCGRTLRRRTRVRRSRLRCCRRCRTSPPTTRCSAIRPAPPARCLRPPVGRDH
jgi:hypothetical protein